MVILLGLLGLLLLIGFISAAAILRGFALDILWGWFVQPVFSSAPDLDLIHAIGLSLVVGFFLSPVTRRKDKATAGDMVEVFPGPLVALGVGFIVRGFM